MNICAMTQESKGARLIAIATARLWGMVKLAVDQQAGLPAAVVVQLEEVM
ncbi:hypothetical protein [Pseudoneobacillus sp. C159]